MSTDPPPPSLAVGVDVGGHGVKAALVDAAGRLQAQWSDHDPSEDGRRVSVVLDRIERAVAELGAPSAAVGVAVPGFFDTRAGVVRSSPNFPTWVDVPLSALLRERLGRAVAVDNDANAAVLGEAFAGAAVGLGDVVMLTLGTGVGSGFLVGGSVVRGARGAAAEAGHVVIHPGGRLCGCGRRGCLEAYASGPGLAVTAAELRGASDLDAEGVFAAALEGDPGAREAVDRFARDLAAGLTTLIHVFAPEAVVLGGGVAASLEVFRQPLEGALRAATIPACLADALPVRGAALGSLAGAVGAAKAALDELG